VFSICDIHDTCILNNIIILFYIYIYILFFYIKKNCAITLLFLIYSAICFFKKNPLPLTLCFSPALSRTAGKKQWSLQQEGKGDTQITAAVN
jgi:hypothetical protein